jgi:hypothetical protein
MYNYIKSEKLTTLLREAKQAQNNYHLALSMNLSIIPLRVLYENAVNAYITELKSRP